MGCERYREALSARLDGEDHAEERAAVDAHLAGCAACRQWLDEAAVVTRLARVGLAVKPAGVPDSVLDAAPGPGRARLVVGMRVLLGVLGTAQLLIAVAQTAMPAMQGMSSDPDVQGATGEHLLHESAAWNLAIGAGFLFVAWRRTRPAAVVPILSAFVAALTLLSLDDLLSGAVAWSRLTSHALLIAGYAIVVMLSRPALRLDGPPVGARPPRRGYGWRTPQTDDNVVAFPVGTVRQLPPTQAQDRAVA